MAILYMDGFDHWIDTAQMTDGTYAEVTASADLTLDNTDPRTGSHAFRMRGNGVRVARLVIPSPLTIIGTAIGYKLDKLPTSLSRQCVFQWRNSSNLAQATLFVQPTGQLSLRQGIVGGGTGTEIANSGPNLLVAGAYNHIEARLVVDNISGQIEVRVNGDVWMDAAGINTAPNAPINVQMVVLAYPNGGVANTTVAFGDDFVVWDTTGIRNNTFLGDQKVFTLYPDANASLQDWTTTGAASAFQAINETPADGDTSYIEATTVNDTSDFSLDDIPSTGGLINLISGVQVYTKQRKTDAGLANTQVSLVTNGTAAAGTDRPLTTAYTYYTDIFEVSPDTGTTWTETEVNGTQFRIKKTV